MNERVTKLYEELVSEYGYDLEAAPEVLKAIIEEFPEATDGEIVTFVLDAVVDGYEEDLDDLDTLVSDFSINWGRKF